MPGTTSLGIRYPYQAETVDAQSWQDMADDIEGLFNDLQVLRGLAQTKPAARVSGGSQAVATTTTIVIGTFTTVDYDTGGYANLGVLPSGLTVPAGIYWCLATARLTGTTTITMARAAILTGGATIWGASTVDTLTGGITSTEVYASGMIVATGSTQVQVQVRWQGTGGPGTFGSGTLQLYQVRALADV